MAKIRKDMPSNFKSSPLEVLHSLEEEKKNHIWTNKQAVVVFASFESFCYASVIQRSPLASNMKVVSIFSSEKEIHASPKNIKPIF